ncbi:MAG: stability determinant [Thiomonas sp. 15-63-373]|jgi:hypothetical protein|nr:MAG: stability determinant [Thiomonas sp. 15-63-373]
MNAVLSPIESEFATQEEAQAHDAWFRQRVLESLADTRPAVPHDQAMARIQQVIADAAARRRSTDALISIQTAPTPARTDRPAK